MRLSRLNGLVQHQTVPPCTPATSVDSRHTSTQLSDRESRSNGPSARQAGLRLCQFQRGCRQDLFELLRGPGAGDGPMTRGRARSLPRAAPPVGAEPDLDEVGIGPLPIFKRYEFVDPLRAVRMGEDVCLRDERREASLAFGLPQIQKRPALVQLQVVGDPCPGTRRFVGAGGIQAQYLGAAGCQEARRRRPATTRVQSRTLIPARGRPGAGCHELPSAPPASTCTIGSACAALPAGWRGHVWGAIGIPVPASDAIASASGPGLACAGGLVVAVRGCWGRGRGW